MCRKVPGKSCFDLQTLRLLLETSSFDFGHGYVRRVLDEQLTHGNSILERCLSPPFALASLAMSDVERVKERTALFASSTHSKHVPINWEDAHFVKVQGCQMAHDSLHYRVEA